MTEATKFVLLATVVDADGNQLQTAMVCFFCFVKKKYNLSYSFHSITPLFQKLMSYYDYYYIQTNMSACWQVASGMGQITARLCVGAQRRARQGPLQRWR